MVMVTHHLHPPGTAPIAHDSIQPAEQTALQGIPKCSKCEKIGHWGPKCHGGKPPPAKNASLPKNAPLTGSQHGKSRFPPGSHSCHPGRGGKTDAIDGGEDHSPQDEIVLYGIQANLTTVATTHTKVNTEEAPTYHELFIDVVNCGSAGDTHPEEIVVDNICALWCNEVYTMVQLPASASRKGNSLTSCQSQHWSWR